MNTTQKIFTIQLKTTDTNIDKETIDNFINDAITDGGFAGKLIYKLDEKVEILFNFLNDPLILSYFITHNKEEFLTEYPYLSDEYNFNLSEFDKNKRETLISLLENTSTEQLAEPYGLTPEDFSRSVGLYIKHNMTPEEQTDFLRIVTIKGFKIEI